MEMRKAGNPKLPSHFYTWCEPRDNSGEESLHFASERRRIKIKGRSFQEFLQYVLPLLDGSHNVAEIQHAVSDLFSEIDIEHCLELLASQNLLQHEDDEIELYSPLGQSLAPQLNFFHEIGTNPKQSQNRLANSTVSVIGLSGAGAQVALSLAAAGVGCVRCVDSSAITVGDTYLAPTFLPSDIGAMRAQVLAERIRACTPTANIIVRDQEMANDSDVLSAIAGSDFVVNCLDRGQVSLAYKLNRACLKGGTRWTSGALSGTEIVLGPTVHPFESPCYLCYKMRAVACAGNPEDEFAYERFLDQRKQDDSGRRENIIFGSLLLSSWLGLEAFKELTEVSESCAIGSILVFDLLNMESTKHVVLRKPWCPACFKDRDGAKQQSQSDFQRDA
ncbi:MAG TPA: TOMM precursor leader peptide-binding protein [Candidatus Acidoferrum sp.]|jgi:adenylyltransferase/sulfurtransferase|nr:TOMM precursor leader peptide-binding protein [Candidatus Acidoferrum sp.]